MGLSPHLSLVFRGGVEQLRSAKPVHLPALQPGTCEKLVRA